MRENAIRPPRIQSRKVRDRIRRASHTSAAFHIFVAGTGDWWRAMHICPCQKQAVAAQFSTYCGNDPLKA